MVENLYINNRKYHKPDYYKALEHIVPKFLSYEDSQEFGQEIDLKDKIINSHIDLANNISSVLNISAIAGTQISSINSFNGIYKYFIKQNDLTNINSSDFYLKILDRVGTTFQEFKSPGEFKTFLLDTLLPSIRLNSPTNYFNKNESASSSHLYLIQNLSWIYFLNTPGPTTNIYSSIAELLTDKLYFGREVNLNDALGLLEEYLWKNNYTSYYPSEFQASNDIYTSGTQQLDKLKTWIDIVYSPLYCDKTDFTVRDRFYLFKDSGSKIQELVSKGPFFKLLRMLSFAALDYDNESEKLKSLNDIDECPKEQLPLLANLIGFKLFGSDPDRWRLQLKNAALIYKKAGTKKSLQFALNTVFPKNQFNIETDIKELWESYVPNLIFYSLATESSYFISNDLGTIDPNGPLTQEVFTQLGVSGYSSSSIDENLRLATDAIIYDLYTQFSGSFNIPNTENGFYYRGRTYPIPPFEEYPYYMNVELDLQMIYTIVDRLVCFGVPRLFADSVGNFIKNNTTDVDDLPRSNSWLFFTSGYNQPPNIADLMLNSTNNRFEYAPLWSSKSSHFKLDINSSQFDFEKKFQTLDSGDSVVLASQVVSEFAPTHAIPLINLSLSNVDIMESEDYNLPIVNIGKTELFNDNALQSNYEVSALYLSSYKRNTGVGNVYSRNEIDVVDSNAYINAISINSIPRNSIRRRNYEKLIPNGVHFDRTGFNMPVSFQNNRENTKIPLGFIPSSLSYTPITDYTNLPSVWSICENLKSAGTYYDYYVSNTLPARSGDYGSQKNLVILAGQSNINGRGSGVRQRIDGIYYWDLNSSSFIPSVIPKVNTVVEPNLIGGPSVAPTYGNSYWGPELKFIERLKQNKLFNTYVFKFAADNSTVVNRVGQGTWCPSATGNGAIYPKFEKALDAAISSLGGFTEINSISLIWSQGESEAGLGQNGNASALQFSAASKYFFDTVRAKFPSELDFNIVRAKINVNFGASSQPDWAYYPSGQFRVGPGCLANPAIVGLASAVSATGHYGFWSWSSTNTVRAQQEALNTLTYGPLVSFDDVSAKTFDDVFSGADVRAPGPLEIISTNCLSAYFTLPSFNHYNIHYVDDSLDIIGNRLFDAWASSTKLGYLPYLIDFRNDRSNLPDILKTLYKINEEKKRYTAIKESSSVPAVQFLWKDVYTSRVNTNTLSSNSFPTSMNDYYNFKFGKDLHKLYDVYLKSFNRHSLAEHILDLDGPNITSHIYGPLIYNSDFDSINTNFSVSSLEASNTLLNKNYLFSQSGSSLGTYSSTNFFPYYETEFSNSSIVSGMNLTMASAIDSRSHFSVFKIPSSDRIIGTSDYMYDRTFIKFCGYRDTDSLRQRLTVNVCYSGIPNNLGNVNTKNFLLPNHKFKLNINGLVSTNTGIEMGGNGISVMIHTKKDSNGFAWFYGKDGYWRYDNLREDITRNPRIYNYLFTFTFPEYNKQYSPQQGPLVQNFRCIDIITNSSDQSTPLLSFVKEDFVDSEIEFHTINSTCLRDSKDYSQNNNFENIHSKDQEYFIEIFQNINNIQSSNQSQNQRFLLLDKVEIIDLTMNEMAGVVISDPSECPEVKIKLEEPDLRNVFKFWNDISGKNSSLGLASRDANETSSVLLAQGGSRLDYRLNSDWTPIFSGITKYISSSKMTNTIMVPV